MHPKIDSRVLEKDYGVRRVIEISGQVLLDAISFENDLFTSEATDGQDRWGPGCTL